MLKCTSFSLQGVAWLLVEISNSITIMPNLCLQNYPHSRCNSRSFLLNSFEHISTKHWQRTFFSLDFHSHRGCWTLMAFMSHTNTHAHTQTHRLRGTKACHLLQAKWGVNGGGGERSHTIRRAQISSNHTHTSALLRGSSWHFIAVTCLT